MSMSLESLVREEVFEPADKEAGTQLFSFLLIGTVAVFGFVLLSSIAMALPLTQPQWLVSAVCYLLIVVSAYLAHRRFSFGSSAPHGHALPVYLGVQLASIGLAALFSWVAYGVVGLPTIVASGAIIALTSGMNFLVLRIWAFKRTS